MRNILFIILISLVNLNYLYSQISIPIKFREDDFFVSPNVSSFNRISSKEYVDLYTGIVSPSISLCNLEGRNLNLPISLKYNGLGIKVEEVSGWTGLGWTLNATGVIIKEVKGQDDDNQVAGRWKAVTAINTQIFDKNNLYDVLSLLSEGPNANSQNATFFASEPYDTEPDIYHFNLPNIGGKFILDDLGNPILLSNTNVKIIPATGPKGNNSGWKIILENGEIYEFEHNSNFYEISQMRYPDVSTQGNFVTAQKQIITTWNLTRIKSAVSQESIEFNYYTGQQIDVILDRQKAVSYGRTEIYWYPNDYLGSVTNEPYFDCCTQGLNDPSTTYFITQSITNSILNPKYISSITSTKGSVEFIRTNGRLDMFQSKGESLHKLIVKNNNNEKVKEIEFNYEYLNTNNCNSYLCKRMFLKSVKETSPSGKPVAHVFEYNMNSNLPIRNSNSQDFWGYFSGRSSDRLIPQTVYNSILFYGANRNPDEASAQANILKRIIYPTGGYTEFEYELNEYWDHYSNTNKKIGGLRAKKVTDYDGINHNNDIIREYKYFKQENQSQSSGGIPYIEQYNPELHYVSYESYGQIIDMPNPLKDIRKIYKYVVRSSSPSSEINMTKGGFVGYGVVTVVYKNNGKEVFKFTSPANNSREEDEGVSKIFMYNIFQVGGAPYEFYSDDDISQSHTISKDVERGFLFEKSTYNESGKILKKENYGYNFSPSNYSSSITDAYVLSPIESNDFVIGFKRDFYSHESRWIYMVTKKETTYELNTNNIMLEKNTNFEYTNSEHKQISKQVEIVDNSKSIISTYKYPLDYSGNLSSISNLKNKNILNAVVEKLVLEETRSGKVVYENSSIFVEKVVGKSILKGEVTVYNDVSGAPFEEYEIQTINAIPENNFSYSFINNNSQFNKDSRYIRKTRYDSYDSDINLQQLSKEYHLPTSVIWGYGRNTSNTNLKGDNYPIAVIKNASRSQVAYTSFESAIESNWIYNVNNIKTFNQNTPIQKYFSGSMSTSNLPSCSSSCQYEISFWAKGVGDLVVSSNNESLDVISINNNSLWIRHSVVINTNNSSLTLTTHPVGGSYLYIDDVQLVSLIDNIQPRFSNFETISSNQNWTYSPNDVIEKIIYPKTGNKYFSDSLLINGISDCFEANTNEPCGYKLSFWGLGLGNIIVKNSVSSTTIPVNTNDNWNYYEVILNNQEVKQISIKISQSHINNNIYLDEIRLHPLNSSMVTLSYKPLVGVISETNERNITRYYEYDSLNRLYLIRDDDRNIIKEYQYNFKSENE